MYVLSLRVEHGSETTCLRPVVFRCRLHLLLSLYLQPTYFSSDFIFFWRFWLLALTVSRAVRIELLTVRVL